MREEGTEGPRDQGNEAAEAEISKKSRRSFLWGAVAVGATYGAWKWLIGQPEKAGALSPLRSGLEWNEKVWAKLSSISRSSPTFTKSQAEEPRPNGHIGLDSELNLADYRLVIEFGNARRSLTVQEVKAFGGTDVVTELRCIEGWSNVVHWTGVPLNDLADKTLEGYGDTLFPAFAYAETPDGKYFVGLDIKSALHPQTLVCWAMNGKDLEPQHGAPLRLVVPTKYGIKSLKRLGLIRFTGVRPDDYWYREGYDWYAGF